MRRRSLYQDDLAYIHHVGFGDFARTAAPGLLRMMRRAGICAGALVDLGCGSGIWAQAAQRAGFSVIGVDNSPAMIRLAKRVAPNARFYCASLHDFPLPACAVVTAIGEGLNYLQPDDARAPQLARIVNRIARALVPGGLFIFDVMLNEGKKVNGRKWHNGNDWAVLTEVEHFPARQLLTRRMISFRKLGSRWRRAEELHRLHLFRRGEVHDALRQAGFSVTVARRYGAVKLLARRWAFIASKPLRPINGSS